LSQKERKKKGERERQRERERGREGEKEGWRMEGGRRRGGGRKGGQQEGREGRWEGGKRKGEREGERDGEKKVLINENHVTTSLIAYISKQLCNNKHIKVSLKITSFVYVYISEKCIVELITECPAKCII
jgi:RNA-binding protein YhbY